MTGQKEYSARLTGEPFLYFELKQVAKLKLNGFSDQEINKKVRDENLFQYKTDKSTGKILSAVLERVSVLDETLLNILINGPAESSKLVAIFAVTKVNRLFEEFMTEVYREKIINGELVLTPGDFSVFFTHKGEQSSQVAGWKDYTLKKLSWVYARILMEAGLINNTKEKKLTPPVFDRDLQDHLIAGGNLSFIDALTGGKY